MGEVHLISLRKVGGLPLGHRTQTTHHLKLVPHGSTYEIGQAVTDFAHLQTVLIDRIAATACLAVAVVVGDEYKGAVGVDGANGVAEPQIVVFESHRIEVVAVGIVDADAKDNQIGPQQLQVARQGTLEIVRHRSAIDPDRVVGDAVVAAAQIDSCERETLPLGAGQHNVE